MIRTWQGMALAIVSALVVALSCFRSGSPPSDPPDEIPPIDVPAEDLKALVDGNNQFAIDLYKQVAAKQDGNLILSPYSISSALAMTYAGARGQTAEEMKKVLHFALPQEKLHPAFGGTTKWLQAVGNRKQSELSIANALWAQRGLNFVPEFLDLAGKSYGAGLREVDFAGNPEAARGTINRWVEEQTRDRIKDLLQPKDIDGQTRLVLSNAIYFRGEWKHKFNKERTYQGDFETSPGVKVKVPMMRHSEIKLRTAKTETWQLLELPYTGEQLAMIVLLPVNRLGLREAETQLSATILEQALSKLDEAKLDVCLPRFQFKSRFELGRTLADMGMPIAISDTADFTGISPGGGLRIQNVIQGSSIEVDELGSLAAAATNVDIGLQGVPHSVTVDQPFLIIIRSHSTSSTLFTGRVIDPR